MLPKGLEIKRFFAFDCQKKINNTRDADWSHEVNIVIICFLQKSKNFEKSPGASTIFVARIIVYYFIKSRSEFFCGKPRV
jgi:hypothetical protein